MRKNQIRTGFRAFTTLIRITLFLVGGVFLEIWLGVRALPHPARQRIRSRRISRHGSGLLQALGFSVSSLGTERLAEIEGGALIVSNHLSFWDVLVLSSRGNFLYVTSMEVHDTPVLGWLARLGGCVFVERRSRFRLQEEIGELESELKSGQRVVLFPEGTSGDGSRVLPFKRSLFSAAARAGVPVLPICLNYRGIDGQPINIRNRDRLFYYGDQRFDTQLAQVFTMKSIAVEAQVLEPIPSDHSPRELSELSHSRIRESFTPIGGAP